ncbi:MAG: VanZ family protein [Pseudoxanthomonas sp.]
MALVSASMLKPLRHPRFWLCLWWLAVAFVVAACLMPSPNLPRVPHGGDKVEHILAFFALSASAVQLYATRRALMFVAIGLLLLGIGIEWAQGAFTADRASDPFDFLADAVGVALGMATVLTPLRDLLLRLDGRRDTNS